MIFILNHAILVGVLFISVVVILACVSVLEAWLEFNKTPKEKMFWCTKHGFFAEKHTLDLFPHLQGTGAQTRMCPICYRDAVFTQPNKKMRG